MTYTVEQPAETDRLETLLDTLGRNPLPVVPEPITARCVEFSEETRAFMARCVEKEPCDAATIDPRSALAVVGSRHVWKAGEP